MRRAKSIVQQLTTGNERFRSAVLVFGWGFCALIAFLFGLTAFQYRIPDFERADFGRQNFAQIPLPPGGEVTTTASIGDTRDGAGNPRFDVFGSQLPGQGQLASRLDTEMDSLRSEIIALRRSAESLRKLNERLSDRVSELELRPKGQPSVPSAGVSRSTRPRGQATSSDPMEEAPQAHKSAFGIDLGRYASLPDVENAWRALRTTEQPIIGHLAPLASVMQQNGTMIAHLLAGPFPNAADAAATCARLEARKIDCKPTLYVGQKLSMR